VKVNITGNWKDCVAKLRLKLNDTSTGKLAGTAAVIINQSVTSPAANIVKVTGQDYIDVVFDTPISLTSTPTPTNTFPYSTYENDNYSGVIRQNLNPENFFPAGGYRHDDGLTLVGEYGNYWSASACTDTRATFLNWCSSTPLSPDITNHARYPYGFTVRCVKN
jgi:hypothetical protein